MPLRSPKRNFFIFGFHRLVWCPKWTPASNNSLIDTTPIPSPPLKACRAPCDGRGSPPPLFSSQATSKTPTCILIISPLARRETEEGAWIRQLESLGTLAQCPRVY